jgi:hypothetical protein
MDCTLKYVFDLLHAGKLKGAVKMNGTWKIPAQSIEQRLEKRAQRRDC